MTHSSRHWLAGSALGLAVLGAALTGWSLQAQPPGASAPPGAFPPSAAGSPSPAVVRPEGLPAASPAEPTGGQTGLQKQGDLLRVVRNVPGDAKPIVLEADQIATWNDGGRLVFLLTGRVLVQQSVVQGRCQQAVAWVDVPRYKQTGVLHMDLYAEGGVRVDTSIEVQDGGRAVLDLNTRGEFRVRASRGKVQRQDQSRDPVVARARALGAAPSPPVKTVAAPAEPLPPVPGTVLPATLLPATRTTCRQSRRSLRQWCRCLPQRFRWAGCSRCRSRRPAGLVESGGLQAGAGAGRQAYAGLRRPAPPPPPAPATPGRHRPRLRGRCTPDRRRANAAGDAAAAQLDPPQTAGRPAAATRKSNRRRPTRCCRRRSRRARDPAAAGPPVPPAASAAGAAAAVTSQECRRGRPAAPRLNPGQPLEHRLLPRFEPLHLKIEDQPGGSKVITVTGGLILNVRNVPRIGVIDVEADRAVVWVKNRDANRAAEQLRSDQGDTSTELEFYLAGHVVFRADQPNRKDRVVVNSDEMYYDARRNVAVAINSRLEMHSDRGAASKSLSLTDPVILKAPELFRTGPNTFEVREAEIYSSKLPSDPGLKLLVADATVTNRTRPRTGLFGQELVDAKGNPMQVAESIIEARNVVAELEGVPFFWTPYLKTDARDPMGPLETIGFGASRVMGFQGGLGWNVYKLLGMQPVDNTRWRVLTDYMSRRGPALGTNFDYFGKLDSLADSTDPDGVVPSYNGMVRMFGLHDSGTDILGGNRPYLPFQPPGWRGRAMWRQGVYDLPYGFNVQSQISLLSDRNFLEQFFKPEFDTDINQANFVYVKQQQDNWAWSALGQVRTSNWITTTEWLPRVDGYLLGQDLFDRLTSNTSVSLAYARLRPSSDQPQHLVGVPPPLNDIVINGDGPTTQASTAGRLALMEELSLPFQLGPVKLVPYAKGAIVGYTEDLQGDSLARGWGGGGIRGSIPFSRLYPDVESELFNVKGLNHKIVLSGNYFIARANEPYQKVAQFDRLNDDSTASMLREFKPQEPLYNPGAGLALATSPLFDPQRYAIRRLIDNRLDTLDDIQVLQLDLRQRLQTKRGYPGFEHIVDWMVLDTSISYFPQPSQDNFGKSFSFAEYNYLWNIGDRTSFDSYGWYDPQEFGARIFTVGMHFNRPDRTTFHLGFRYMDPLNSRIMMGAVSYVFSPKYSMTASVAYDFGTTEAVTNTLVFTRTGSDLQVSVGFMYNSLQNNFGAIFEIVPNLVPVNRRGMGVGSMMTAASTMNAPR
ncbi:MAG: hypothetical protein U0736_10215 [Gemmataceae bacterium]